MKLATTTSDFMCFGLNGEESVGAVADAGFKYIDYGFGYDFHGKTGLLGNEWQSCAERLLALADERGLKFVQAHSPLGRPLVFDDEHEEFVRLTKQSRRLPRNTEYRCAFGLCKGYAQGRDL